MTILGGWLLALAAVGGGELQSAWNVRDHVPLDEVVVQSHRGAGALSAENTREAFEIAWKLGAVPEADLRTSRDGVIVAFHDADFQRMLPQAPPERRRQGVADLTWDELRQLDVGAWKGPQFAGQRIARLADVFDVLRKNPERKLYVDFKDVDLEQLAREAKGIEGQLILASTKYDLIRRWKRLAPKSATLHWMGGSEAELAARLAALEKTGFADVTQLQIHVRTGADGALTPSEPFLLAAGEQLRRHGVVFQAFAWDRQDAEIHTRLMDLGVASFATDHPDVVLQTIRAYYEEPRDKAGAAP